MSAIDRVLIWAKEKGMVFATQSGGHPDDYLDELLPQLNDYLKRLAYLEKYKTITEKYTEMAFKQIPSHSNADAIFRKMYADLGAMCEHCGGRLSGFSCGCQSCGAPVCCQSCCKELS